MDKYVLGVDFGTLSARAILVNALTGEILAEKVSDYEHQVMYKNLPDGTPLPDKFALQHPIDYINALTDTVKGVIKTANVDKDKIVGIANDFTSCTLIPVNKEGVPLCFLDQFKTNPHAYAKLWKHHYSQDLADKITKYCHDFNIPSASFGGKVSSEWLLPKVWETYKFAKDVFDACYRFYEVGDYINYYLTGIENHSVSFLGFKGLWTDKDGFLFKNDVHKLDDGLKGVFGSKISEKFNPVGTSIGKIKKEIAYKLGLSENVFVATSIIDAHASMPALGINEVGNLMLVIGTSACQIVNSDKILDIKGICGYAKDAVLPPYYTYEAGQPSCGDQFKWFIDNCVPYEYKSDALSKGINIHRYLRDKAEKLAPAESGLLSLDWFNGNRSTLNDANLSALILGLNLNTKPEEIYRALLEGTAFGTKMIVDNFEENGLPINKITATGGIANNDPLMMQIYADVLDREIFVSDCTLSGAYGSAIYASVASGIYPDIITASKKLGKTTGKYYYPKKENALIYKKLYAEYKTLYDYFGKGGNDVMKRLIALKTK
ncbi:MAG: ribulokinase [Clostridia bacterium]|nr:ribulokinase [Clostridia bacterium]